MVGQAQPGYGGAPGPPPRAAPVARPYPDQQETAHPAIDAGGAVSSAFHAGSPGTGCAEGELLRQDPHKQAGKLPRLRAATAQSPGRSGPIPVAQIADAIVVRDL